MSKGMTDNQEEPVIVAITEDELRDYLAQNKRSVAEWDVLPKYLWGVSDIGASGYGGKVMSKNT
jgi:hypothetical protein